MSRIAKPDAPPLQPPPRVDPAAGRSGAQVVVDALIHHGVEIAFGFPGGAVIPLYDEIYERRDQLRHVLVRHEQGAVHAAQAYARVSGKTGVAIATSGPGASNLITGLMDAHLDSTPVVVIGGQVTTDLIGKDAFQETDMMGMTNPVTKHNFQCRNVDTVAEMIDQAFHIASTGRPGPVYIDLPKDVQLQRTQNGHGGPLDLPTYTSHRPVDQDAIARAVAILREAERPLLLLGQGVLLSGASEILGRLARELEVPVTTTILAKGAFDERHPLSLGCLGMHGRRCANDAVSRCDVLLAIGCRFSDRVTGEPTSFAEGKRVIHVDIDPYEIGKNVPAAVSLNCDAREAGEALYAATAGRPGQWKAWTKQLGRRREICDRCIADPVTEGLHPKQVMNALGRVLAEDDIVATGVGQHQMFASHYLWRSKPRTYLTSGGAGTMGFGLPAAIGATLARPDVNVWLVDGDGSLQMTVQELGTLAACGGRVKILVIDNGYLGMVRQWQELFHDRRYSAVTLDGNPDFVRLAEAYGIEGRRAADLATLEATLAEIRDVDHSVLVHIPVAPESNIKPMVPPGGRVADFFGYCIPEPGRFFAEDDDVAHGEGAGEAS